MLPDSIKEYREPFLGGGSVFLSVRSLDKAQTYWINDKFEDLILFWKTAKNRASNLEMTARLEETRFWIEKGVLDPKTEYEYIKEAGGSIKHPGTRAMNFFYLNRVTFSGTTLAGGYSPKAAKERFTQSSIVRVQGLVEPLKGVKITSLDYTELVEAPGEDVFLFLDPPYYTAKKLYGNKGALHDFPHEEMAALLKTTSHKFLLTYDDCPEIRNLYSWANIKEWKQPYSMGKSRKKAGELFIYNYEP